MSANKQYVLELAETVDNIFTNGTFDPSAEEIAEAHFPDRALGGEIVEGIRKKLHLIREVLEVDYDHPVYLLSETYYTRYRKRPPNTHAEATRCIPVGKGKKKGGIRLRKNGDDDLIWQAMLQQNVSTGAGKVKRQRDRVLDAVEDAQLSEERAAEILEDSRLRGAPSNPRLHAEVTRLLPDHGRDR